MKKYSVLELYHMVEELKNRNKYIESQKEDINLKKEHGINSIKIFYIKRSSNLINRLESDNLFVKCDKKYISKFKETLELAKTTYIECDLNLKNMFLDFAFKDVERKCGGIYSETNSCEGKLNMVYPDGAIRGFYMCDKCLSLLLSKKYNFVIYIEGIDF